MPWVIPGIYSSFGSLRNKSNMPLTLKALKYPLLLLLIGWLHACGGDKEKKNEIVVNGDPVRIGEAVIYNELDFPGMTSFSVHLCSEGFNLTPDYNLHDSLLYHEGEWQLYFEYLLKPLEKSDYSGKYHGDTELKVLCNKNRSAFTMGNACYQFYSGTTHRLVSFFLQDAELSIQESDSLYELEFTFEADTFAYSRWPMSISGHYKGAAELIELRPGY
jgi:hypothetical protein